MYRFCTVHIWHDTRAEIVSKYWIIVDEDRSIIYGALLAVSIAVTPLVVDSFMKTADYNDLQLALITTGLSFIITAVLKVILKNEYQDVFTSAGSYLLAVMMCILFLYLMKDMLKNPELTIVSSVIGSVISFIGPLNIIKWILGLIGYRGD